MDSHDIQEAASASLHKQNAAQNQNDQQDLLQKKHKVISLLSQIDFSKHQQAAAGARKKGMGGEAGGGGA